MNGKQKDYMNDMQKRRNGLGTGTWNWNEIEYE